MILETYPEWECYNRFRKRLSDANARIYRGIHLSPDVKFFIVELCIIDDESEDEDGCIWATLFLKDFDDVLESINQDFVTKSRINLFVPPRYNDYNKFGVYEIKKIYKGKDCEDWNVVVYNCENGKSFTTPATFSGTKLKQKSCIYPLN